AARGVASLRRILKMPERWDRIVVLAAEHGGHLPATPDAGALAAFLVSRRDADRDTFEDLSLAVVKLLGKGEYALSRPGAGSAGASTRSSPAPATRAGGCGSRGRRGRDVWCAASRASTSAIAWRSL